MSVEGGKIQQEEDTGKSWLASLHHQKEAFNFEKTDCV